MSFATVATDFSVILAVKPEETVMLQTVTRLLPELALLLMTAVAKSRFRIF
jgi:hypothetical protein